MIGLIILACAITHPVATGAGAVAGILLYEACARGGGCRD